jgi:hypothetical protein
MAPHLHASWAFVGTVITLELAVFTNGLLLRQELHAVLHPYPLRFQCLANTVSGYIWK